MKKFLIAVLVFLYLGPVFGYTISVTSCNMKGMSSACVCSTKKDNNDCCKSKKVIIKLNDSHQKAALFSQNFEFTAAIISAGQFIPVTFTTLLASIEKPLLPYARPPDSYERTIYLLYRVFRI